ncbi:hypothetical protein BJ944DRAFT_260060 [Cunninghamella echinulata]|nr:hypothetical protein BJ944DRAFT_260060 [Cunninghamella echinulata]
MNVNIHDQTVYNNNKNLVAKSSIVTGPPAKLHWKPDSESEHCEYEGCATYFGIFERRHHCRRCGDIFCNQHCSNYFRLDQDCKFNNEGILCRGCDNCIHEYNQWMENKLKNQQAANSTSSSSSSSSTTHSIKKKKASNHHLDSTTTTNALDTISGSTSQTESISESSSTIDPTTFITSTRVQRNVSPKKSLLFKRHPSIINQSLPPPVEADTVLKKDDETSSSSNELPTKSISIDNSKNSKNKKPDYTPLPSVPKDWTWSTF